MGIPEQIQAIDDEIAKMQHNKRTEYHWGRLKARKARLQAQLIENAHKTNGSTATSFEVKKRGTATVSLLGFPSVGKSSLIQRVTNNGDISVAASYEFTTLTCIPGMMEYNGAQIQILDLPGIIEGASNGAGRGREVISTVRSSDLCVMILDAYRAETEKRVLTQELANMGVRLNKVKPDIEVRPVERGGVNYTIAGKYNIDMDAETIKAILNEHKLFNVDVVFRCNATVEDLIDVLNNNIVYLPCLYVINKIDTISINAVEYYAKLPHTVVISVQQNLGIPYMKQQLWEHLNIIRVYTKKRGEVPDLRSSEAIFMKRGVTVEILCNAIHKDLFPRFQYALIWGTSAPQSQSEGNPPQKCSKNHILNDGDVIQLHLRKLVQQD